MAVDESSWDGAQAMSDATNSSDPYTEYRAICAGRRDGDPNFQATWALPHHKHAGDPPNADGVRAAVSRFSQTQGLIDREAARAHLEAHMTEIHDAEGMANDGTAASMMASSEPSEVITLELPEERLTTLSTDQRRIGLRIIPYDVVAVHPRYGALMFRKGAFGEVDPAQVRLRMDHADPPTGVGRTFSERPDGAYMDFQLSKTQRADEQLTLAVDGVSRGASVGFESYPSRTKVEAIGGQPVTVYGPNSARLSEVSTTWQPTFSEAGVTYVLSKDAAAEAEKGTGPMGDPEAAPVAAGIDYDRLAAVNAEAIKQVLEDNKATDKEAKIETLLSRFDEMVELQRAGFQIPHVEQVKPKIKDWFGVTLRRLAGEHIRQDELVKLALDDVITSEQPGLVPEVFTADYDDVINRDRPFLASTRQVRPPDTGNTMTLPIITTRAVAGTQAGNAEKGVVTTTAPKVGTGAFSAKTILAGADISVQMILRAERSFLDLLDEEFAEAYALDCEVKAIAALLAGYTDSASGSHVPTDGGVMDPEDPNFGDAFRNSVVASRRRPTHAWMSVDAVAAFIDAKNPTTNGPLWSNLAAAFTAGGGEGGVLSGLTPVYVPALDDSDVDIIIGPSRGFVWAEDPALRLQADNPGQAGRDIVLAGILFPAPRYADAFTTYTVSGS